MSRRPAVPPPPSRRRPPQPRRARRRGRLGPIFALLAVLLVVLGGAGATLAYARLVELSPVTGTQGSGVVVTVRSGESLSKVAADLESLGLIRSAAWFAAYARLVGIRLHAGSYRLDSGMGASEVVTVLEGEVYRPPVSLTIPEGLTVDQVAEKVGARGLGITRQQYLAAVAEAGYSAPFLAIRPPGDTSLEGFLFPDTYEVPAGTSARQLVQMQLDEFGRFVAPLLPADHAAAYAALITASIVQVEVLPPDFPKVASVIANRLARGMRLQIDATVMYGLHRVGQPMSAADEATDSPFNTYLHGGLPPTPIDSPGWAVVGGKRQLAALDAALHPASTDYLFYVTDTCGHAYYSVTAAVHQQQVQEYVGRCSSP